MYMRKSGQIFSGSLSASDRSSPPWTAAMGRYQPLARGSTARGSRLSCLHTSEQPFNASPLLKDMRGRLCTYNQHL